MKSQPEVSLAMQQAEREIPEILGELEAAKRKLRDLARRLTRAARTAPPVAEVNGERYTAEEWLAGLVEATANGEFEPRHLRRKTARSIRHEIEQYLGIEREDQRRAREEQQAAIERAADELAKVEGGLDALLALQEMQRGSSAVNAQEILVAIDALPAGIRGPLESSMPTIAKLRETVAARAQSPAN